MTLLCNYAVLKNSYKKITFFNAKYFYKNFYNFVYKKNRYNARNLGIFYNFYKNISIIIKYFYIHIHICKYIKVFYK